MRNYHNNYCLILKEQLTEKYQSKLSTEGQKPYLDNLIDPSFQSVNRLFVLSFADNDTQNIFFQK